jgi:hypothetical protein
LEDLKHLGGEIADIILHVRPELQDDKPQRWFWAWRFR